MIDVREKSIRELQELMRTGAATSKQITISYIKRIMAIDQDGPKLNAVAELNPDAIFWAEAMDRERADGKCRGPLHGIPILIKDNISTGDKMRTTAGSVALADNLAREDAPAVRALRGAGAVILGKTNLTEFANYIATTFPDGYSSRGGQVLNPYDPSFLVSGSSAGSASAAAASLCAAALGTETAGSITCPALFNSICGLKPTVGLVSRSGIIPICGQDTAGPMGRTVEDCAILLSGMITGEDPKDPATIGLGERVKEDYAAGLGEAGPHLRVGINPVLCEVEPFPEDSMKLFEKALNTLREAGATLIETPIEYTGLAEGMLGEATMLYEFRSAMDNYLSRYATGQCRSLADVIEFNKEHRDVALKYGQDLLELAQYGTSGRLLEADYWKMKLEAIETAQASIDHMLDKYSLDAIVSPGYSNLPPITGYPVISVPAGYSASGIPVGISFYSSAYQERAILGAAYQFEKAGKFRRGLRL